MGRRPSSPEGQGLIRTKSSTHMQLAIDTFIAPLGDKSVVLDLRRDRYFALNRRLSKIALEVASGRTKPDAAGAIAESVATLVAQGVLSEGVVGESCFDNSNEMAPLIDTYWPSNRFGVGLDHVPRLSLSALWAVAQVERSLRKRAFVDTVAWLRARHSKVASPVRRIEADKLIDAYHAARPWFPAKPICRLDAPAICIFLWAHGHNPFLVFGVRADPFRAHCWVQIDGQAILEPYDRLQQFTPIMSV